MSNTTEVKNVENTSATSNTEEKVETPSSNTEEKTETTTSNTEEKTETPSSNTEEKTETTTSTTTAQEMPTKTGMSIPFISLSILQCVIAFMLIVVVLQQSKSASSITSSSIVGGASDSYWNKNKGRSKEGKLAKMTIVLGIIFFIITISLGFIK